ncbi:HAD family hydrolase [Undibacterium sp.]|uniref:HAD family hydrolase n=1 Tax=Undibacterium sp. TaxID=1914977 RepID=UPI0025F650C3|nr:HAD family hydrolase [Undibacterium sp.]
MTLYVSDLDGTLLDRDGKLSARSRAGLTDLLEQGLLFTVASARHVSSIRSILGDLPLRLPVISGNGAYLGAMASDQHELVHAMEPALAQSIFALIRRLDLMPFFSTHNGQYDQLFYQEAQNLGQQGFVSERLRNADPRLRHTPRLQDHLLDPVVTFVIIDRAAPLLELQAEITALCGDAVETHLADDLYLPGWPWLTVHDRRASKDQAIKTLADRYSLNEREIVVFGDHVNDVSMLRAAHRGIAMENAIAAVKQEAHTVIGPHYEDSVLQFIQSDWRR